MGEGGQRVGRKQGTRGGGRWVAAGNRRQIEMWVALVLHTRCSAMVNVGGRERWRTGKNADLRHCTAGSWQMPVRAARACRPRDAHGLLRVRDRLTLARSHALIFGCTTPPFPCRVLLCRASPPPPPPPWQRQAQRDGPDPVDQRQGQPAQADEQDPRARFQRALYGNFDIGFDHFSAPDHPTRAVRYTLRCVYAYRMLIGACCPMVCPIHVFRRHRRDGLQRDEAQAKHP